MKLVYFSVGLIFLFYSCKESSGNSSSEVQSIIAAGGESEQELQERLKKMEEEEKRRLDEEKKNSTTLKFDKLIHDFGTVKAESDNSCKFKVTNTGDKPLIIDNVSASCGCTMPYKPEKPIPPGESDYIEVNFKSKPGQVNEITKTVTVVANTSPKISEIQIRAFVK
jgi:hypothetical protein